MPTVVAPYDQTNRCEDQHQTGGILQVERFTEVKNTHQYSRNRLHRTENRRHGRPDILNRQYQRQIGDNRRNQRNQQNIHRLIPTADRPDAGGQSREHSEQYRRGQQDIEEFYKLKYCSTVVYMVPRA